MLTWIFCSFASIAGCLPRNPTAKLTLLYLPIALEYLTAVGCAFTPGYIRTPSAAISKRYGALILIILGEGIIGIIRSLSATIAGFGISMQMCTYYLRLSDRHTEADAICRCSGGLCTADRLLRVAFPVPWVPSGVGDGPDSWPLLDRDAPASGICRRTVLIGSVKVYCTLSEL